MKKVLTVSVLFLTSVLTLFAQTVQLNITDIVGAWRHYTFYYVFGETGIMSEVQIDNEPLHYNAYYYELISGTYPSLIRYGKDLSDSASCSYLLVTDLADSTAIIAFGTPFIRISESEGLRGTWVYADDLTIITWEIGTDSVTYSQQVLDLDQGIFVTDERHEGTFTRGRRENTGRFFLTFDDNSVATVYPLIAGDIMYLFDLTGRRSKYIRVPEAPAYIDYKEAQAQSSLKVNTTR